MARLPRKIAATGIYHVMLRGINRATVFRNDDDCEMFLCALRDSAAVSDFIIHGYCLMGNHIHLLLQTHNEPIGLVMKRIEVRFVARYNMKYDRCGPLFQGRFRSECVNDRNYFCTVLRYIHRNPVAAGIVSAPSEFEYSSYSAYAGKKSDLVNTALALKFMSQKELLSFFDTPNEDSCMDLPYANTRISDMRAQEVLEHLAGLKDLWRMQLMPQDLLRSNIIKALLYGISRTQFARLTGLSFRQVCEAAY